MFNLRGKTGSARLVSSLMNLRWRFADLDLFLGQPGNSSSLSSRVSVNDATGSNVCCNGDFCCLLAMCSKSKENCHGFKKWKGSDLFCRHLSKKLVYFLEIFFYLRKG